MNTWLVDTGPLIALLCADDDQHSWSVEQVKTAPTTVLTCDAVISEAAFLLKREGHETDDLFALIDAGFLRSEFRLQEEHGPVRELMRRYRAQPMSFADACLVRMAEIHEDAWIWTLDRDFRVYRRHRRQSLPLIAPW